MTGGSNLKCGDIPSPSPYHLITSSRHVNEEKVSLHSGFPSLFLPVLAAGFTAAILKKRSSTINIEPTSPRSQEEDVQKKEPLGIENMMLSSLEKLFPIILNIPDVNMSRRTNENCRETL
ncbi:hypothetical protein F2Q69_00052366 [Brassica cretica]|uniref:Uncharacterized protein n=1 Tax=Brassica cretica TaxID=69181 RepID=A0A8S9MP15_BRACR|nr:hypothetical protein F2Q69_00052366 [Brassica cretica]